MDKPGYNDISHNAMDPIYCPSVTEDQSGIQEEEVSTSNSRIFVKTGITPRGCSKTTTPGVRDEGWQIIRRKGSGSPSSIKQSRVKVTSERCNLPVSRNNHRMGPSTTMMKSNSTVYVVQNGELVPLPSGDIAENSVAANQEKSSSLVRIMKTSKVDSPVLGGSKVEKLKFPTEKGPVANQGIRSRGPRATVYTPVKVKTLPVKEEKASPSNKDSTGIEFVVFENADNGPGGEANKRLRPDDTQGPKKKRIKIVTPGKVSISNDDTNQSASFSKNSKSVKGGSMENLGNRICRIKVEPPQHGEIPPVDPENDEDLVSVMAITRVCKTEPREEAWQVESNDSEEVGLFDNRNVVISVNDGITVNKSTSESRFPEEDRKPLLFKEESSNESSSNPHILKLLDSSKRLLFQCGNCGYSSKYKNSVKRHMDQCGKDNSCSRRSCIFPNCQVKFYHVSQMIRHMEVMHSACIGVKNLKFSSLDEFHVWKEKEEIANFTYFTKHRGDSQTKNGLYSIYICQNDGSNKSHRRKNEPPRLTGRKYKKGTIKTGATCPSRMFVTVHQGEVTVKYFYSHNHELKFENTQFHPIARKSLDYIKSRFAIGASPKQVQDELRNKAVYREKKEGDEECVKGQLISLRTLNAIKHVYLSSFRLDKDDANSVFLLVKEWEKKDFNPIMLYKPQDCPIVIGNCNKYFPSQSDVFFIALQTELQFELLNSSTSRFLCIDATYCNGRHGFYLLSLIIHDECGTAMPVAHLISNCKTGEMIKYFFSSIKERCPNLVVHGVMTDLEYTGWEAFLAVFGYVNIHVVCHWHIKRNWKKKVETMVEGEMQREVMSDLSTMLKERDEQCLSSLMVAFKMKYENTFPKFVEYFQTNIVSQPEIWATCFRDLASCNSITSMHCKAFHDTLEIFFTKTKAKKRIDDLLILLLRIEETDNEQRLPYGEPVSYTLEPDSQVPSHTKSLDIADADVTELDGSWKVICQEDRSKDYEVIRLTEECQEDLCTPECQDLPCGNLCSHLYKCSCGDNSALCEHIHKVHSGKSNVIIICSPDTHIVFAPGEKKGMVLHEGPLEPETTAMRHDKSLLNSAYDNLGHLGTYINQVNIQRELLPHIAATLEQLLVKCRELSQGQGVP